MTDSLTVKFCGFMDKITSCKPKKIVFIVTFALYIVMLSLVSAFHEPWFDEAQAWQIARCASLHDIFFTIPHYEGHPPLWYLLLLPFAKTGMPYEFSLAFVNIIFSAAAARLIMFKTKLPDLMRLTLPFTYFFFYQYGVISRPYSVMAFAFMLCAVFYRGKSDKPLRMVLSLALLCASSAYGLAIAAGICVVWLAEEWNGQNVFKFIKGFIRTKAFFCLLGLLVFAVLVLISIIPCKDAYGVNTIGRSKNIFGNLFYTLFVLPFDATVGNVFCYDAYHLAYSVELRSVLHFAISALIIALLFLFGKKHRRTGMAFIQFAYLPILFTCAVMFAHHIGISTMFLVFWLCICFDTDEPPLSLGKYDAALHYIFTASACIFIAVQIGWSVSSAIADIKYDYAPAKKMAEYIKENNLENSNIMSAWYAVKINENNEKKYYLFNSSSAGTAILPYFDSNIFYNFNWGRDDMGYNEHRDILDEKEYEQTLEQFRQLDTPDYLFGSLEFGDDKLENIFSHYYYIAESVEFCMVYKGQYIKEYSAIYKFEDIENVIKERKANERTD